MLHNQQSLNEVCSSKASFFKKQLFSSKINQKYEQKTAKFGYFEIQYSFLNESHMLRTQ